MLITLVTTGISAVITYYVITPVYQANTLILVNQNDLGTSQIDLSQIRTNIDLINTYSVIIKSPAILGKVIQYLDIEENIDQLDAKITVNSYQNSQVFLVKVEDENAERAVELANVVSQTFQTEIKRIMHVDNVNILAEATLMENPVPIHPKPLLYIAIGLVFGLTMSIGLVLLLWYLNHTITDGRDIESTIGLPVLGSVERIDIKKLKAAKLNVGVETVEG
ncbi:capsular polysaccharide biosynthesis protein [Bacillus luteolus]|nr:capsular polysaccharide biosynthesis protein [Cytobacillus luteolus]